MWPQLMLIPVLAYGLVKSTDWLVVGLKSLSEKSRVGEYFITTFVVGIATSLPELAIAVLAAGNGEPAMSLGNVLGSNIANLTVVVGGAVLLAGRLAVSGRVVLKDIKLAGLANLMPWLLLSDLWLSRADGIVLLTVYYWYVRSVFRDGGEASMGRRERRGVWSRLIRRLKHNQVEREGLYIVGGLGLMLVTAQLLVATAGRLAEGWGVSLLVVGILVVGLGTSLPELVLSLEAIRRGDGELAYGNLLGSLVANTSLVLGLTALLSPFGVAGVGQYGRAVVALLAAFGLFYIFAKSKGSLSRLEGGGLVLVYGLMVVWEIWG